MPGASGPSVPVDSVPKEGLVALHDFYSPGERERIARGEFNSTQVQLRELLEGTGARRVKRDKIPKQ